MKHEENRTLSIRYAISSDARRLFEWRNDKDARKYFRNPDPISWKEHVAWLSKTLRGKVTGRILCIAESPGMGPIGMIRGDETAEGVELAYIVAPQARGLGLGKKMVAQFIHEYLPGKKLRATILKDHHPSESIARFIGLSPVEEQADGQGRMFVTWK